MLFGNNTINTSTSIQAPADGFSAENPIQYEVGEICKCYFTEIEKNVSPRISQQIEKCQSYCRIVSKRPDEVKEYTVSLFDGNNTTKKLPGRCLRKVKLIPYTYSEAAGKIGAVVESNDDNEDRKVTMIVTVVEDSDGNDEVEVNSMSVSTMKDKFHFKDTGAPFCNIVMLKADEAFTGSSEED